MKNILSFYIWRNGKVTLLQRNHSQNIQSSDKRQGYLIHQSSDKVFHDTVVNRQYISLNEGSLEISFTVPLWKNKINC